MKTGNARKNEQKESDDFVSDEMKETNGKKVPNQKKAVIKEIISWVIVVVSAIVIGLVLNRCVIFKAEIPSGSMENTLLVNDRIIGNRLAYTFSNPKRGDIIMFDLPDDESMLYIKRIIGLPGERVEIIQGKVYINGSTEPLNEPYLKEEPDKENFGPYDIPEGCYFVMGDNRNYSQDARYWEKKYVPKENIRCKAVFRYKPYARIGFVK